MATQDTDPAARASEGCWPRCRPCSPSKVRSVLCCDDDYATIGNPPCDWDDPAAHEALVDATRDAPAALALLHGEVLERGAAEQRRCASSARRWPPGRPEPSASCGASPRTGPSPPSNSEARHGYKSRNRRFDGYKTHVSVDPDSELIAAATATPGNPRLERDRGVLVEPGANPEEAKPEAVGNSAYAGRATECPHQAGP